MQSWLVMCWLLSALACAEQDQCPNGDSCVDGHTCCSSGPSETGYNCCPFDQAECCQDHVHCCPGGTVCDADASSCANDTASVPWVEGTPAGLPTLSKSFWMVRSSDTEDDDNICPDESRCPPEYSCLRALTRFSCCPLAQGVSCGDRKHCCPAGHQCSADSRSCIRKEAVCAVICGDGEYECPEETTCCGNSDGSWGCCPIADGVCCEDRAHCCPAGSTCDVDESKCVSLTTSKETPMWAKLPARKIAAWERVTPQVGEREAVTAVSGEENSETTSGIPSQIPTHQISTHITTQMNTETNTEMTTAAPLEEDIELSTSAITTTAGTMTGNDVVCSENVTCLDGDTCCKKVDHSWGCCPLAQAVCCEDLIHCCPHGKTCNLRDHTCDDGSSSMPWVETSVVTNVPAEASGGPEANEEEEEEVEEEAASTPPPPTTTTTTTTTVAASQPRPADTMGEEVVVEGEPVQCDTVTTCPVHTTCCFMSSSKQWGCCPLPKAVCCYDGEHCCPTNYKCDESKGTCYKGEVAMPWYTKVPAVDAGSMAAPHSVACDAETKCPVHFTCCLFPSGHWGCCPLYEAVCCDDEEHCCPRGYTCDAQTASCQQVTQIQLLRSVPFTRVVVLPQTQPRPQGEGDVAARGQTQVTHCHGTFFCSGGETCCRILPDAWACCPTSNAVCCGDMRHCCPAGYTCHAGTCTPNVELRWNNWRIYLLRPERRARIL